MAFHDLNVTLSNLLIGWRREWAETDRIARMYTTGNVAADAQKYGDTITKEGRSYIKKAALLKARVEAALMGFLYVPSDDLDFQMQRDGSGGSKWGGLIAEAESQNRLVREWPLNVDVSKRLAEAQKAADANNT